MFSLTLHCFQILYVSVGKEIVETFSKQVIKKAPLLFTTVKPIIELQSEWLGRVYMYIVYIGHAESRKRMVYRLHLMLYALLIISGHIYGSNHACSHLRPGLRSLSL